MRGLFSRDNVNRLLVTSMRCALGGQVSFGKEVIVLIFQSKFKVGEVTDVAKYRSIIKPARIVV